MNVSGFGTERRKGLGRLGLAFLLVFILYWQRATLKRQTDIDNNLNKDQYKTAQQMIDFFLLISVNEVLST